MLTEPSSPIVAGLQAVVIGCLALGLGYLIVDTISRLLHWNLEATALWGLSLPGTTVAITALTLVHVVTGGRVFSNPFTTRTILLGATIVAVAVRFRLGKRSKTSIRLGWPTWGYLLGLAIVAMVVWGAPLFNVLPLDFSGDTKYNAMWASELLNGESTPVPIISGNVPNGYPYLWHGFVASLAIFTPGGRALNALGPMQVILVIGSVLSLFALGRELINDRLGGLFLATFGALSGGFGWVMARAPALVVDPRNEQVVNRYLGDFMSKRSYNIGLHNLAPPYPRDLTYALMASFLLLLIMGLTRRSPGLLISAGVTMGFLGLTGGEAFFVAFGISLLLVAIGEYRRFVLAACLFIPALALYACWAIPLVINYLRYDGFVKLSALPVSLTPAALLGSWGLTTPFAVLGARWVIPTVKSAQRARVMVVAAAVPAGVVIATSLAGERLSSGLETLGRPHRYWPLLYLSLALFASVGGSTMLKWLIRRHRLVAYAVGGIVIASSIASPILASIEFSRRTEPPSMLQHALANEDDTLLRVLSPRPGGSCVVAVPAPLSRVVPGYTGYRVVFFPGRPSLHSSRLRFPDVPDITPYTTRKIDNGNLVTGRVDDVELERLVQEYGLDAIVTPPDVEFGLAYDDLESTLSADGYTVVWIDPRCRAERYVP